MHSYAVSTFVVSLAVTVLSAYFSGRQASQLAMGLEPPGDPENSTHPTFLEPSIVKARVSHSLDVATNFPAAILTIVAFMNPEVVPPGTGWIFLAIVAVAITMATYGIAPIKFAGRYSRLSLKWVSPYSVALIVANSFGLVTVLT